MVRRPLPSEPTRQRPGGRGRRARRGVAAVLAGALALAGCGGGDEGSTPTGGGGARTASGPARIIEVPKDEPTIQRAVDAARPGDLVLISPGTYREAVQVTTPRLVIRGAERNGVVLDGRDRLLNGFDVSADRVAIENLTVRRFAINGVVFRSRDYEGPDPQAGPSGWRASYVTAEGNGLYGLYAFGTGPGQFDHNTAVGSPDSGIYVGQCRRCGALVIDNTMERNTVGYENTNASGVVVARNQAIGNRIGMAISSGTQERLAPTAGVRVVGNLVAANDGAEAPGGQGGYGVGIVLGGGQRSLVARNRVVQQALAGVLVTDQDGYQPTGNRIERNAFAENAYDVAFAASDGGRFGGTGSCLAGFTGTRTFPDDLATQVPCGGRATVLPPGALPALPDEPGRDATKVRRAGPQPDRPGDPRRWQVPAPRPTIPDLARLRPPPA